MNNSYAKILFDTVLDKDLCAYNLIQMQKALDKQIYGFLTSPIISKEDKKEIIDQIPFNQHEFNNFLKILIDDNMFNKFDEIVNDYQKIYLDYYNIIEVNVKLARPVNGAYYDQIINQLAKQLNKNVVVNLQINQDLIGGIVLSYEDKIIDNSILNQLNQLEKSIRKEVL